MTHTQLGFAPKKHSKRLDHEQTMKSFTLKPNVLPKHVIKKPVTMYNQCLWVIPVGCLLHYCRLKVRMKVARTPQSMKKGSQVLRNAAQLKDTKRETCVTVIIHTCIFTGRAKRLLFKYSWTGKDMCGVCKYHTIQSLYSHGPTAPSLPFCECTPAGVLLSFPPSQRREPHRSGDLQRWHRGGALLSVMNYTTPLLCAVGVYLQRQHKLWRQSSLCGSAENNEGGSLCHMSPNAHERPAAEHFKKLRTCLWWRCFRCVWYSIVEEESPLRLDGTCSCVEGIWCTDCKVVFVICTVGLLN